MLNLLRVILLRLNRRLLNFYLALILILRRYLRLSQVMVDDDVHVGILVLDEIKVLIVDINIILS
jgi:hypothetical protein